MNFKTFDNLNARRCFVLVCAISLCGLSALSARANAATLTKCVHTPSEFQDALTAAQGNTGINLIEVARGTYNLTTTLTFSSTTAGQLDIGGGYDYDGGKCSTRIENPALTVVDGGGTVPVFYLQMFNSSGIQVRFLTIQNGHGTTSGLGLGFGGLNAVSDSGSLTLNDNIIRSNQWTSGAGFSLYLVRSSATATIEADGNLVYGNILTGAGSGDNGGSITNNGSGNTYVTNNTFADNTGPANSGYAGGLFVQSLSAPTDISNNIFWGNANNDISLTGSVDKMLLVDNDYTTLDTTGIGIDHDSGGNVTEDPQFLGSSDLRLSATSPLLGQGLCNPKPVGGLPTMDIEGNPRTYALTYIAATCKVDMGAYERGDEIFKDGYDD